MFGSYYDPTWILLLPAIVLAIWAQARVNSTYKKYDQVQAKAGAPAYEMARQMLEMNGIYDVKVEQVGVT